MPLFRRIFTLSGWSVYGEYTQGLSEGMCGVSVVVARSFLHRCTADSSSTGYAYRCLPGCPSGRTAVISRRTCRTHHRHVRFRLHFITHQFPITTEASPKGCQKERPAECYPASTIEPALFFVAPQGMRNSNKSNVGKKNAAKRKLLRSTESGAEAFALSFN